MRNTYLIDFENVSSEGLAGVTSLTPEDRVIIFYSANSSRMTLRAHQQIVASTAKFDYFEVVVGGKNALDHQLGTYLGYLVATKASERYFIVSHDNGFKYLSSFWLSIDNTLQISLVDNIKVSLRTRSPERARPTPVQAEAAVPAVIAEPVAAEPAAVVEPIVVEPIAVEPVVVEPVVVEPVVAEPVEPVVTEPVVVETVVAEPVVAEPVEPVAPEKPVGPLPALGSQSRSGRSRRVRVNSDSILATLPSAAKAEAPVEAVSVEAVSVEVIPAEEPAIAEPETAAEILAVEPAEPAAAAESVAEAPAAEEPAEPTAAAEPVAEEKEPAAEPVEAKPEPRRRSRGGRGRSRQNREAKAAQAEQEKASEAEVKPEDAGKSESNEKDKAPIAEAKSEPKSESKPEAKPVPAVIKPEVIEAVSALLQPFPKVNEGRVRELISLSKKQVLCNMLRRQLGQEQGLALYNQIKRAAWK